MLLDGDEITMLKISEVIKSLEEIKNKYGDIGLDNVHFADSKTTISYPDKIVLTSTKRDGIWMDNCVDPMDVDSFYFTDEWVDSKKAICVKLNENTELFKIMEEK